MAAAFFNPILLPMLELHTVQFGYYAEHRSIAAEASALGPSGPCLQQLYRDDPSRQGICLRPHRTGDVKRILLIHSKVRRHWVSAWLFK